MRIILTSSSIMKSNPATSSKDASISAGTGADEAGRKAEKKGFPPPWPFDWPPLPPLPESPDVIATILHDRMPTPARTPRDNASDATLSGGAPRTVTAAFARSNSWLMVWSNGGVTVFARDPLLLDVQSVPPSWDHAAPATSFARSCFSVVLYGCTVKAATVDVSHSTENHGRMVLLLDLLLKHLERQQTKKKKKKSILKK